jgi:hypothetical protein
MGLCKSKNIKIYQKMNKKLEKKMKKHGFYIINYKTNHRDFIYSDCINDISYNNNKNIIKIYYNDKFYVLYYNTEIKYQRILYYNYKKKWIDVEIINKETDIINILNDIRNLY